MRTDNSAHDVMREFVKAHVKGYIASAGEIKDWCMKHPAYASGSRSSIIPSDCCYNRFNNDPSSHVDLLFEFLGAGKYRCLGEKYPYTGVVLHAPRNKGGYEYVYAHWNNGVERVVK